MPKPKYIKVERDGLEGEVTEESLATWEKHGWTVVDDGSSEEEDSSVPNEEIVEPSAHPSPRARKQAEAQPEVETKE